MLKFCFSTGILTGFPSVTRFRLTLGPDSPTADKPSGGTLRFSGHWILTSVYVTQADILTSASTTNVSTIAFRSQNAPLPIHFFEKKREYHSFGIFLSPVHFRRNSA